MDEEERKELEKKAEQRGFVKGVLVALFIFLSNLFFYLVLRFLG